MCRFQINLCQNWSEIIELCSCYIGSHGHQRFSNTRKCCCEYHEFWLPCRTIECLWYTCKQVRSLVTNYNVGAFCRVDNGLIHSLLRTSLWSLRSRQICTLDQPSDCTLVTCFTTYVLLLGTVGRVGDHIGMSVDKEKSYCAALCGVCLKWSHYT